MHAVHAHVQVIKVNKDILGQILDKRTKKNKTTSQITYRVSRGGSGKFRKQRT